MKKIVRSIVSVALMLTAATGMSNEPKLRTENASKNLVLELDAQHETTIKFTDKEGYIIYVESNSDYRTYFKKFNLETLPDGTYYLEIEDSLKELVYTINIANENVGIGAKRESLKPVFRKKEDMVFVNLLNLEKEEVEIKILDEENRIVFDELFSNETIVQKAFDFATAKNGSFTIIVKRGNDSHYENVYLK